MQSNEAVTVVKQHSLRPAIGRTAAGAAGPRFNIKMTSYQYRKSHCEDKTILRPSYLHNGISYTGKITSLYWIKALVSNNVDVRLVLSQTQPGFHLVDYGGKLDAILEVWKVKVDMSASKQLRLEKVLTMSGAKYLLAHVVTHHHTLDFELGMYAEAYHALMKSSGMYPSDWGNDLTVDQLVCCCRGTWQPTTVMAWPTCPPGAWALKRPA